MYRCVLPWFCTREHSGGHSAFAFCYLACVWRFAVISQPKLPEWRQCSPLYSPQWCLNQSYAAASEPHIFEWTRVSCLSQYSNQAFYSISVCFCSSWPPDTYPHPLKAALQQNISKSNLNVKTGFYIVINLGKQGVEQINMSARSCYKIWATLPELVFNVSGLNSSSATQIQPRAIRHGWMLTQ